MSDRIADAIEYLQSKAIPVFWGGLLHKSCVDVVAYGCIGIDVKFARLELDRGVHKFTFKFAPSQQVRGLYSQVVMLICDWPDNRLTFHLFDTSDPVFYMRERLKSGLTYTPGAIEAKKHGNNRVVMMQSMMDSARDNIELIEQYLAQYRAEIANGATLGI